MVPGGPYRAVTARVSPARWWRPQCIGGILRRVSRTLELTVGLMLLVIGLIVLSSTWIGEWFAAHGFDTDLLAWWPLFLVFATVDRSLGHKGITAFIVERAFPGFSSDSLHGKLGVRAGNTGILYFSDCEVPVANRVGEEGEGFTIAMSAIDQGRYTVAAGSVGLAVACLDASVKYAHERKAFGEEIGRHQLVKQMLARMQQGIEAGRLLVWKAGWLKNQGLRSTRETGLAKWFCTDHAVQCAMDAIQIHGAYGYSDEYPVERYLRNSKGSVIYEGTSQIHTLMQADYLLGYRTDKPLRMPQPAWEGES